MINGPFTFAPDGNPLVGPVQGLTNFWVRLRGHGGFQPGRRRRPRARRNWMANGDPGLDVWGMDVARFGEWATLRYTNAKVRENYSRRFSHPLPQRGAAGGAAAADDAALRHRCSRRTRGDGRHWGLETPLWFAPKGVEPKDIVSFHRSNDFPHVGDEVRAVREGVGVTEIANFAKYEVTGPGAEAWLDVCWPTGCRARAASC